MFKERLETGAILPKFDQKTELLKKHAPTWLGRLVALTLIAFVAQVGYHSKSSLDNTPTETNNTQDLELAPLTALLIRTVANYSEDIVGPNPPELTPPAIDQKVEEQKAVTETGELSRITGYYCQQVPGYPIGDGGGYCGPTAAGTLPQPGTAACGEKWPLGTKLEIAGFGEVICTDRGHLAQNQVDIFFPTNKDLSESSKPDWAKVSEVE